MRITANRPKQGVANAIFALPAKGLSKGIQKAEIKIVYEQLFNIMTSKPLIGLGSTITLAYSFNTSDYTLNDLRQDYLRVKNVLKGKKYGF